MGGGAEEAGGAHDGRAVVICGFGELGQSLANMLESPLAMSLDRGHVPYVAFDLQPSRLRAAREAGFNVFYGDASRPAVRTRPAPALPRPALLCREGAGQRASGTRSLWMACKGSRLQGPGFRDRVRVRVRVQIPNPSARACAGAGGGGHPCAARAGGRVHRARAQRRGRALAARGLRGRADLCARARQPARRGAARGGREHGRDRQHRGRHGDGLQPAL